MEIETQRDVSERTIVFAECERVAEKAPEAMPLFDDTARGVRAERRDMTLVASSPVSAAAKPINLLP